MQGKKGLARLLELAGERRQLLAAAAIVSAVSAILMLVPYASIYVILRELLEHAANPSASDGGLMIRWGVIAFAGLIGSLACMYVGGMLAHIAAFRILYGMRIKLSGHIGRLPLGYLNGTSTGAIKKTMEQNVEKIETFIAHQLPDLVHVAVTAVVMLGVMLYMNIWLALACALPIAVGFTVQMKLMSGERAKQNAKRYHDALEQVSGSAVQFVKGMPAIKVFGQSVHSFKKFYKDMIQYRDYCVQYADSFQNGYLAFKVMLSSFAVFILPAGVLLLQRQPDSIALAAVLLFFLVMAPGVSVPMMKMMFLASTLRDINEGVERIDRILEERPVPETSRPVKPERFDIQFHEVSFSYHEDQQEAVSQLSFKAAQNEVTALVGPSGSGKSTVASLIPRFWDASSGCITIGGVDIRHMSTDQLMDTVGFVFQESFMLCDTLYNNIAIGRPDASEEEVRAAAKAAQCHDFIMGLPQGYGTLIGEGGVYLSGGEEQRVAVARAILKNAPILVLDEATAFADPENEYEMQQALKQLMKGKTVIVIAHRLSSIRDADQIIVLDQGRMTERGKHEELIRTNGKYAHMWAAYTDAGSWQLGMEGSRQ